MSGVIQGGWSYVWAAYSATAAILGVYSLSLILRMRRERDAHGTAP